MQAQGGMAAADVVLRMDAARGSADWEALRSFFHPRGRFLTLAGGPAPLGPDETLEAIREAAHGGVFAAVLTSAEEVDDGVVLSSGRVRYQRGRRVIERESAWVLVLEDGLIFRALVVDTPALALEAYRRLGRLLGHPDGDAADGGTPAQQ